MSTAAQTSNSAYPVGKPRGICAVSGVVISPGEAFISALVETPAGFERRDVRIEAWPDFPRDQVLAFWRTTMPAGEPKKKNILVDDATLADIFERLANVDSPEKIAFRFVLGLVLLRKRLLTHESTRKTAAGDVWVVRLRGRAEPMEMIDPHVDESQIQMVQEQLAQVLSEDA